MEFLWLILRAFAIFIVMMVIIRLLGKRELGQLSIFDLVILLIIADIGSMGIDDGKVFLPTILCLFLFLILQKIFSKLLLHFSFLRKGVDGAPTIIVLNGQINIEVLKKELYNIDDLITQMRANAIMDVSEIRLAVLETSGNLSVFSYARYKEVILPVIVSGEIDENMLPYLNLTKKKVEEMVKKQKLQVKDIHYASSDGVSLFIAPILKR